MNANPIEEQNRLRDLYAAKTDEELESVADEAYQLTDTAQEALRAEIHSRGLKVLLRDGPKEAEPYFADDDMDMDPSDLDLVPLERLWDLEEARQIKSTLLGAGIPCFLGPDNIAKVEAFDLAFKPGMDMKVRGVDRQTAMAVLAEFSPKTEAEPAAETNTIACCPRCHSPEIVFQGLETPSGTKSDFDSKFNWSCDACGYQWSDDGVEQETPLPEDEEIR